MEAPLFDAPRAEQLELPLPGEFDPWGERWIRNPQAHGQQLHGGGKGILALCQRTGYSSWRENVYPVEVALELLPHYAGKRDVYLSMQRFRARRTVAQLLSLSSLYVDLDFYSVPRFEGYPPWGVLMLALEVLEEAGVPSPTLGISSGRGIYLIWQHEHIKRSALPRWNRCQRELYTLLQHMGADPKAKDAARVLRLVGTRNREARAPVEPLIPVGDVFGFDDLANRILPYTPAQIHDLKIRRAMRAPRNPSQRPRIAPRDYDFESLWETRLGDLQRLRELRFMEATMSDYRSRWLWISGVGMGWLASDGQAMRRELYDLALEAGGWSENRTRSKLKTTIERTYRAWAGERVEWDGDQRDPRYRFTNQRIIEELEIDADEERYMQTIISDSERRRREKKRDEQRRRDAGKVNRNQQARERRRRAGELRSEGLTRREVAEALGVSERHVKRLWREGGT